MRTGWCPRPSSGLQSPLRVRLLPGRGWLEGCGVASFSFAHRSSECIVVSRVCRRFESEIQKRFCLLPARNTQVWTGTFFPRMLLPTRRSEEGAGGGGRVPGAGAPAFLIRSWHPFSAGALAPLVLVIRGLVEGFLPFWRLDVHGQGPGRHCPLAVPSPAQSRDMISYIFAKVTDPSRGGPPSRPSPLPKTPS